MDYKIGNLRALTTRLIEQAERDGNEAEHQLGVELVELARREGLAEDDIVEALTHGKTGVRVESALAKAHNADLASDSPNAQFMRARGDQPRNETWEGYIPEVESLEEIFRFFNRVDQADADRLRDIGYDLPSLSVGDVVEWNGVRRRVEPVGWVEVQ